MQSLHKPEFARSKAEAPLVLAVLGFGSALLIMVLTVALLASSQSQSVATMVESVEPGEALGVVLNKDLVVIDVEQGSSAQKAGIKPGDVIKEVDGVELKTKEDARTLVRDAVENKVIEAVRQGKKVSDAIPALKIKVIRNGKSLVLSIVPSKPQSNDVGTPTAVPQNELYF